VIRRIDRSALGRLKAESISSRDIPFARNQGPLRRLDFIRKKRHNFKVTTLEISCATRSKIWTQGLYGLTRETRVSTRSRDVGPRIYFWGQ
jgi:hypothetical protein